MRVVRRILLVAGLTLAAFGYVWTAAVRAAPGVRSRKAEARRRRDRGAIR